MWNTFDILEQLETIHCKLLHTHDTSGWLIMCNGLLDTHHTSSICRQVYTDWIICTCVHVHANMYFNEMRQHL